eukprot:1186114-Prorocentrum_minimum.AAC.6
MGWTEPPNLLHAIIIIIIGWSNKPKLDERFFHRIVNADETASSTQMRPGCRWTAREGRTRTRTRGTSLLLTPHCRDLERRSQK